MVHGHLPTRSEQVRSLLDSMTPEQLKALEDGIDNYEKVFETAGHPFRGLVRLYGVTDLENQSTAKEATCTKGCAFCCSIRVVATELETDMIARHCREHNIEIDTDKLEQQKDLDEDEYLLNPHKRCTFLAPDNSCKIYDVRPFACRNHYVANDPALCDTDAYPHGLVAGIENLPAALPAVAVMRKYEIDSFPKLLLKSLKKY